MKKKLICLLWLVSAFTISAQTNLVDKVIWVVGDEPILLSDVEEARISAESEGMPVEDPYCTIPEQIAVMKLYLHQAALDSIEVSDVDVNASVERRIEYLIQLYGSRENLELTAKKTVAQIRADWRKSAKERELMERAQRQLTRNVKVTPAEVREFFKDYPQDSLPLIPEQVEVQIVTSTPQPTRAEVERIEEQLRDFARRVNNGEADFAVLAMSYSQDDSRRKGGELGFMGRNELVPEFANVAWSLTDPKRVSKIVRSEYGFHIIQLIEKRGNKVNCRHILLKPEIEESEFEKQLSYLDSIANDIRTGFVLDGHKVDFEEAALAVSDDKETRSNKGNLYFSDEQTGTITSRFQLKQLPQEIAKVVDTLEVGQISNAFRMIYTKGRGVCAIVKLKNRIPAHRANVAEDFQVLRDIVQEKRSEEVLDKWIREKIKSTYVRIDKDWTNCNFRYEGWVR